MTEQQLAFDITNTIANLYLALGDTKEASDFANEALNYAKNNPENLVKIKKLLNHCALKRTGFNRHRLKAA